MNRFRITALLILLLAVGTGVFLATRISPEVLANSVQKVLNERLDGGKLSIGSIEVSLLPEPECTLKYLRFMIDGTSEPLIQADAVRFGATWDALLSGDIVFKTMQIETPDIRWNNDAATKTFLTHMRSQTMQSAPEDNTPVQFAINAFTLKDGRAALHNPQTNATLALENINITLAYGGQSLLENTTVAFSHASIPWRLDIPTLRQHGSILTVDDASLAIAQMHTSLTLKAVQAKTPRFEANLTIGNIDGKLVQAAKQSIKAAAQLFPDEQNSTKRAQPALPDAAISLFVTLQSFADKKVEMHDCTAALRSLPANVTFKGGCRSLAGLKSPSFELSISPRDNLAFEGSLYIGDSSPQTFIKQFDLADLNASSPLLKHMELTATFFGNRDKVQLRDTYITLDDTEAVLTLTALNRDPGVVVFDLAVDHLDADAYRKAIRPKTMAMQPLGPEEERAQAAPSPLTLPRVAGQVRIGALKAKGYPLRNLQAYFKFQNDALVLDPLSLTLFDGRFEGKYRADFSSRIPAFHLLHTIRGLDLQQLNAHHGVDQNVQGHVDLTLNLDLQGRTPQSLIDTAKGQAMLDGHNIIMQGINIDQMIASYQTAKYLQFADMVLLFTTGPLGGLVSMGTRAAITASGAVQGGETHLPYVHTLWVIDKGKATAKDVAAKTKQYRIAMTGEIDLGEQRFNDVRVAVVDRRGCAEIQQRLDGPIAALNADLAEASGDFMTGSIKEVLDMGNRLVDECPVFYRGTVK